MRRSRWALVVLALVTSALVAPTHGRAWESECRPDPARYGGFAATPDMSICAGFGSASPFCAPGTGFARGAQLGEHAHIARRALLVSGLSDMATMPFELRYWGTTATVSTGNVDAPSETAPSIAPARIGAMSHLITRTISMPGLAQLPDGSHSLSDYMFGNEHCAVGGLHRDGAVGNRSCHTFAVHMGLVNSSHFQPQAREVYARYHHTAGAMMMRCADLATRLGTSTHPWVVAHRMEIAQACEREAMAFELFGSHFLADAWSTGHMWERWGSPIAPRDEHARLQLATVAIVSGFIHGSRAVTREHPVPFTDHDRLCLAGPGPDRGDPVQWMQPATIASGGGGDLYLLQCLAYEQNREHAVASGAAQTRQFNRMISCVAHGMGEIYDLGPQTLGARSGTERMVDGSVNSSSGDECWTARVTNHSFRQGLSGTFDLADPSVATRLGIRVGRSRTGAGTTVTAQQLDTANDRMRIELGRIGAYVALRDDEENMVSRRTSDVATLDDPATQGFMGYWRNSHYTSEISSLAYLDSPAVASWEDPLGTTSCTTDGDCFEGEVCDPTGGPNVTRACVDQEVALLRSFRIAEIARNCEDETVADLDAARALCRNIGGESCDACEEVLLPHLRNGCDQVAYRQAAAVRMDHGSICDELRRIGAVTAEPASVYLNYRRSDMVDATRAARELCTTPPPMAGTATSSWDGPAHGTPTSVSLPDTISSYFENHGWCGPVSDFVYWHHVHPAYGGPTHTHTFVFETAALTDLPTPVPFDHFVFEELSSCDGTGTVVRTATPFDSSGDGTNDAFQIPWTPPNAGGEICIRLRNTMDLDVTGWRLRILP